MLARCGRWRINILYLVGIIGAFIYNNCHSNMGSLGPAKAAMLIVISPAGSCYIIELFGLFGVEKVDFNGGN